MFAHRAQDRLIADLRTAPQPTITELLPSWERSLRARGLAARTVFSYLDSAQKMTRWFESVGMPAAAASVSREHVEAFIVHVLDNTSPGNAATDFARLQQLFRWLDDEGEIVRSPMLGMSRPPVVTAPPDVIPDDQLAALLRACKGTSVTERRDAAIIRLWVDTGIRLDEMARITPDDVDWKRELVRVTGKGSKVRFVPISPKTAEAIDRWDRQRRRLPDAAAHAGLWLGRKGPLTGSGLAQMLERRCIQAGIPPINPHRFRHTAGHVWLANGGQESDLMQLMGWRSPEMVRRYGASAAAERAQEAHRRMRPGDRV